MDITYIQDLFRYAYLANTDSREKGNIAYKYYNNEHFTSEQLEALELKGQPSETFNVIKKYSRLLLGYYSKGTNMVSLKPTQESDSTIVGLLSDTLSYINYTNSFSEKSDSVKLDCFLAGLMVFHNEVVEDKDIRGNSIVDKYGRKQNKIIKRHILANKVVLDPLSSETDYSDARFIHTFKWVAKDVLKEKYPKADMNKLDSSNSLGVVEDTDSLSIYSGDNSNDFSSMVLVIHTILLGAETKSIVWSGDSILEENTLEYSEVKNPYVVVKLSEVGKTNYIGIFADVLEAQNSINQALLQIQQLVNSDKTLVQDDSIESLSDFTDSYSKMNSVTLVRNIAGIKILNFTSEITTKLMIIEKSLDRVQELLGINDSFLGMAYASDSGAKVNIQKQASVMSLRYINTKLELFYKNDSLTTLRLIKQFFRANQVLRVSDEIVGDRYIEINKPMTYPDGSVAYMEHIDPKTGNLQKDKAGAVILTPLNDPTTDLSFTDADIIIENSEYSDSNAEAKEILDSIANSPAGQMLAQVNPKGYMEMSSLAIKQTKFKYSQQIAQIFATTAEMLTPQPQNQTEMGGGSVAIPANSQPKG